MRERERERTGRLIDSSRLPRNSGRRRGRPLREDRGSASSTVGRRGGVLQSTVMVNRSSYCADLELTQPYLRRRAAVTLGRPRCLTSLGGLLLTLRGRRGHRVRSRLGSEARRQLQRESRGEVESGSGRARGGGARGLKRRLRGARVGRHGDQEATRRERKSERVDFTSSAIEEGRTSESITPTSHLQSTQGQPIRANFTPILPLHSLPRPDSVPDLDVLPLRHKANVLQMQLADISVGVVELL